VELSYLISIIRALRSSGPASQYIAHLVVFKRLISHEAPRFKCLGVACSLIGIPSRLIRRSLRRRRRYAPDANHFVDPLCSEGVRRGNRRERLGECLPFAVPICTTPTAQLKPYRHFYALDRQVLKTAI
jgi:hypothetical protein